MSDFETEKLPENIVNFTTLKIKYNQQKICQCKEPTYIVDFNNRLVTCSQCGAYTDPFDALVCLANRPERYMRELKALFYQRQEIADYKPHMVVFRNLEQFYRKKKHGRMLPSCPRCNKPFYFEDIDGWVNEGFYKREEAEC